MELSKIEFNPIINDLHVIRRSSTAEDRNYLSQIWKDKESNLNISLAWNKKSLGIQVMRLLESQRIYPIKYDMFLTDPDTHLSTHYGINGYVGRRTIYKTVTDSLPIRERWPNMMSLKDGFLENSMGINDMTFEDVDVIKSVIAGRILEISDLGN